MRSISKITVVAAGLMMATGTTALRAQEGPVPTATVVTIQSNGKPVDASMFTLQVDRRTVPIDSLTPAMPQGVELGILIDEGLRSSVANQLSDIAAFIQALPPSVKVLIGYMANGGVRSEGGFMNDHEALVKQLRIPMSIPGQSGSPYFCLSEFVKHWPSNARASRVVLMITNGVDPYNGSTSIMNQDSPYVETAQRDAQRAGVAVYALYYGDAGMRGGRANFSGQSYLSQLTQATGGESLYNGSFSPVGLAPYLTTLRKDLEESYVLGFQAPRGKHDELVPIKVKSKVSGVKVRAPDGVRPGRDE